MKHRYSFDRSAFVQQTVQEAADHQSSYRKMSAEERQKVWWMLMAAAFGFTGKEKPVLDRTVFSCRHRE
ncbi:MAG: hypothetical protein R2787_08475 [Saprospiraceae bacterium]